MTGGNILLYLLLAILSSALISIIMRLSTDRVKGKRSMLAANYLTCLVIAALFTGPNNLFPSDADLLPTLGMGIIHGILYLLSFLLFQWCVEKNGVVLPAIFMKLGLLVPLVVSVAAFREIPTLLQVIGFVLAVAAIILINLEKDASAKKAGVGLILLLLIGGAADAMSKVYEEIGAAARSEQFLFYTFLTAFLCCAAVVALRREKIGKNEVLFGFLIGIPNFFSARFLLMALTKLHAVIVYPTYSVATILAVTLAGVILFKERLNRRQKIALVIILAALILLNL